MSESETTAQAVVEAQASAQEQTGAAEDKSEAKDPNWLPARLERERRSMLKQLGVENVDDVKKALAELKQRQDAEKSEQERLRAQVAELESAARERDEYRSTVAAQAAEAMASLTPEQRAAVESVADTPAKQLKAIASLRPTWKAQEASKPLPAPASTAPAASAPAPAASAAENHLATWEKLKASNPIAAAYYLDQYQVEIIDARKARK